MDGVFPQAEKFVLNLSDVHSGFICKHCNSIMCEPTDIHCGDSFCNKCAVEIADGKQTKTCPICGLAGSTILHPNKTLKSVIQDIQLKCPWEGRGCKEQFRFKDLRVHTQNCSFENVPSVFSGCNETMPRGKLGQHINICEEQNKICQDPECPVKKVWRGNLGRAMFLCKLVPYKPICTEKSSCSRKVKDLEIENG